MHALLAEGYATELIDVQSSLELDEALQKTSQELDFDHLALSLEFRPEAAPTPGILLPHYTEEWAKVYVGFELAGQDPVRRACDKTFIGFVWHSLDKLIPLTRGDRQMLQMGRECGIGDGFTVSRHLPGFAQGNCTFAVSPNR